MEDLARLMTLWPSVEFKRRRTDQVLLQYTEVRHFCTFWHATCDAKRSYRSSMIP